MTQANNNIEAANSQNDVDQAKTTGEASIDQVTPTVNKKLQHVMKSLQH